MPNVCVYNQRSSLVGELVRLMFLTVVAMITELIDMRKDRVHRKRHYDGVLLGDELCALASFLWVMFVWEQRDVLLCVALT